MNRTKDKILEIKQYLEELNSILPSSFKEYENNLEKIAAVERYFEKIVEATNDLARYIIKKEKFSFEEGETPFGILLKNKVIEENLFERLKFAKGMRNILSHKYGEIDNQIVFQSIREELLRDIPLFIKSVEKYLEEFD
ncbi:MAG: DUF86 domain-containing protein [Nanoarchaeota archaeon]|nr:DUF86 domain-containing protein [Nanoarchaeota archaeon]